jgi:ribosomal protein S6--L-glutamate ligase
MRIAILGSPDTYESKRIEEEAKKRGHQAKSFHFYDLVLSLAPKLKFFLNGRNILEFDAFIFRGMTKHLSQALLLAAYLKENKKIIIDERLATGRYITSKISSSIKFSKAGLPIPKTIQPLNIGDIKTQTKVLGFPLIVKKQMSSKGRGVMLAKNFKQLGELLKNEDLSLLFLQQYIPSNFDVRVLVLGGRILGAIKRTAKKGEFRSNIAQGGTAEVYLLNKKIGSLAIAAAKASGNEFAGVDIMIDSKNKPYILESNRAPQFKGFEEATGINVAQEIVKYIERRAK